MDKYMDYLDDLIKNHPLTDDEYIFKKKIKNNQSGGQLDKPTGGFPPIILCDKLKQKEMIDKSDEKELATEAEILITQASEFYDREVSRYDD
jgi:hypothetical protein